MVQIDFHHFTFISGLDRHWDSHVYCGKKGVSWDMQQPTSAIVSAILQHLSGISSRIAQTRASSAILATGSDESMDHDWSLSIGLDPTLTLTSATGNISQFTADAYARSHVMLMLRSAAELTMQAMVSLAPKISQMGVYNRDLCGSPFQIHLCLHLSRSCCVFPLLAICFVCRLAVTSRGAGTRTLCCWRWPPSTCSSKSMWRPASLLWVSWTLRQRCKKRIWPASSLVKLQMRRRKVPCLIAVLRVAHFFCCAICFCDAGAPRRLLRAFKSQFLAA
jgi:hypothetical protein